MKQLVDAHLTYDQVKNILEIPPAVGAKITAKQFEERTAAYLESIAKTRPSLIRGQAVLANRPSSETAFGSGRPQWTGGPGDPARTSYRQRVFVARHLVESSESAVDPARRAGYPGTEQMSRKMLRNVEKRGVHTARNGPSPPPTPAGGPVAKPEMSTADRLGPSEGSSRAGPPQGRGVSR